jgi:predicted acyl esterase
MIIRTDRVSVAPVPGRTSLRATTAQDGRGRRRILAPLLALCLFLSSIALSCASGVRTRSVSVAMADGVRLATDIYLPEGSGPFPVILSRTPYDKHTMAAFGSGGAAVGYAVVIQVRHARMGRRAALVQR